MSAAGRLRSTRPWAAVVALITAALLAGCTDAQGTDADPDQVDAVAAPTLGACRVLGPEDVALRVNATRTVACTERHTAETYRVGDLPDTQAAADYDDPATAVWAAATCRQQLQDFLGADESQTLRSIVTWSWFRPSEQAWDDGARWYRCDAVGGGELSRSYAALPTTARGLLAGRPERREKWMACARGTAVDAAPRVPCTRRHDWRAVGTIKVGEEAAPYPGDTSVRATSDDFCRTFVAGWLSYPDEYDYGYTFFGVEQWAAGVRRAVCWARTAQ